MRTPRDAFLDSPEPIWTWGMVQDLRGWDDHTLALAQAEAEHNGFGPAMYLPIHLYVETQEFHVEWMEIDEPEALDQA